MPEPNPEILQPGPELDALAWIAMGRRVVTGLDGSRWLVREGQWTLIDGEPHPVLESMPSLSTDPAAMTECWSWLDGQNFHVDAKTHPAANIYPSLSGTCEVEVRRWVDGGWPEQITVVGNTPAHALALLVIQVGATLKEQGIEKGAQL